MRRFSKGEPKGEKSLGKEVSGGKWVGKGSLMANVLIKEGRTVECLVKVGFCFYTLLAGELEKDSKGGRGWGDRVLICWVSWEAVKGGQNSPPKGGTSTHKGNLADSIAKGEDTCESFKGLEGGGKANPKTSG